MCSQPIVQDAQPERATLRISALGIWGLGISAVGISPRFAGWLVSAWPPAPWSAPKRPAASNVAAWKLRVGSAEIALNASRFASVPSSRYLAVAGPKDRSRRSRAAARTAAGSAGATLVAARTAIALRFF